jgi:hypothetical protein
MSCPSGEALSTICGSSSARPPAASSSETPSLGYSRTNLIFADDFLDLVGRERLVLPGGDPGAGLVAPAFRLELLEDLLEPAAGEHVGDDWG